MDERLFAKFCVIHQANTLFARRKQHLFDRSFCLAGAGMSISSALNSLGISWPCFPLAASQVFAAVALTFSCLASTPLLC
jgi:hypothetical protein